MAVSNEKNTPKDLFGRVDAFTEKYRDLMNRVAEGLEEAEIAYRSKYQTLWASDVLWAFLKAVDAIHPSSPVVTSEDSYPDSKVTTSNLSLVIGDNHYTNGLVKDWLPIFRNELKDKIQETVGTRRLKKGELSTREQRMVDTYTLMGDLIEGLKQDYIPLQTDLESYRTLLLLDRQKKQERPVEEESFALAVKKSRARLGKERS
jgi:hypothetical protein